MSLLNVLRLLHNSHESVLLSILCVVHHPDHVIHLTKLAMKDYPDVDLSDPQLNSSKTILELTHTVLLNETCSKLTRRSSESGLSISLLLNETCLSCPKRIIWGRTQISLLLLSNPLAVRQQAKLILLPGGGLGMERTERREELDKHTGEEEG